MPDGGAARPLRYPMFVQTCRRGSSGSERLFCEGLSKLSAGCAGQENGIEKKSAIACVRFRVFVRSVREGKRVKREGVSIAVLAWVLSRVVPDPIIDPESLRGLAQQL